MWHHSVGNCFGLYSKPSPLLQDIQNQGYDRIRIWTSATLVGSADEVCHDVLGVAVNGTELRGFVLLALYTTKLEPRHCKNLIIVTSERPVTLHAHFSQQAKVGKQKIGLPERKRVGSKTVGFSIKMKKPGDHLLHIERQLARHEHNLKGSRSNACPLKRQQTRTKVCDHLQISSNLVQTQLNMTQNVFSTTQESYSATAL